MQAGQLIPLSIEKPAAGGRMIARVDGQVVLVAGAIPGERVTARVERLAKGVAYADTITIEEPSADRRPAFPDPLCGGCLYAHIAYPRQLQIKGLVIADAFGRIAHLQLPSAVRVAASPEDGYRMRARLHVRGERFGFFREGTHDICDARLTRQLLPATCDVLERLVAGLRSLRLDQVREIELSENAAASERVVHLDAAGDEGGALRRLTATEGLTPGPYVTDAVAIGDHPPIAFRRHVLAFFQGNRHLLRDLVAHVIAQVLEHSAALDLYAGVGLFSIASAATRGTQVTAVEGDRFAAADLAANAAASRADVTAVHQPVEAFLNGLSRSVHRRPDGVAQTIIIDPPRTGVSREALDGVVGLRADRLVYVSCDVATLARDARRLVDAGYRLDRVDAFDLFPNTPHVETVAVFSSRSA
jgi:23S rRNA (uracil1939-C5)-methyltransferase